MTQNHATTHISRDQWREHPRFATQALLLGSHASFRRISAHLVDEAEGGGDRRRARVLFDDWKQAMRNHEAYEEHKLYPFLSRRWGVSCEAAQAGHEALAERDLTVRAGFETGEGLVDALRDHHEVLLAHLALEEDLVIPLLLALTPEEFDAYSRGG